MTSPILTLPVWPIFTSPSLPSHQTQTPNSQNSLQKTFPSNLLSFALKNLSLNMCELFAVACWEIWKHRNRFIHEGFDNASATLDCISRFWHHWCESKARAESNHGSLEPGPPVQWGPPRQGSVVINSDASSRLGGMEMGIVAIIRDCNADLKVAMGEKLAGRISVRAAELLAIAMGLEWAVARGWSVDRVETDYLEAADLVGGVSTHAPDGHLADRVRSLLYEAGIPKLSYVPRSCNVVADAIAKHVARLPGRRIWDYNAGLALYGDKVKPKIFSARFSSPDGSEVLNVVIKPSNQFKITFLEAKDITDLGSLKEVAKNFVPYGSTLYSARTLKIKEEEGFRTYYFYEFGREGQHAALVAAVGSGRTYICGATAPESKWDEDGMKLRSAAISMTVL